MSADAPTAAASAYLRAVVAASEVAAQLLVDMERVAERLAPERVATLAAEVDARFAARLAAAETALDATPAPAELTGLDGAFRPAFTHARACATLFAGTPAAPAAERIPRILAALHHHAQAQECFYPLRALLPAFRDYWTADAGAAAAEPIDAAPGAVVHVGAGTRHGGFALFVPQTYSQRREWPLIVALHGGAGNGRDFLWTWMREARARGYLLVAPSAVAGTWGELEERGLLEIVAWIRQRHRVDGRRILLTGLSDGGTFTLVYGLAHPDVFRALAPLCGVLHPANLANGNVERARGLPIYLVHGARDFLFPVVYARMARDVLASAGADLTYRELPELSHAYPRSENGAILDWFARRTPTAS